MAELIYRALCFFADMFGVNDSGDNPSKAICAVVIRVAAIVAVVCVVAWATTN